MKRNEVPLTKHLVTHPKAVSVNRQVLLFKHNSLFKGVPTRIQKRVQGQKGVSQGSVLWPLLFLVYINDKAEYLNLTRLFADDSSLFYSAAHIDDIADSMICRCCQFGLDNG